MVRVHPKEGDLMNTTDRIKSFIATVIAPALAEHNGYLLFKNYDADTKTVGVTYAGMCANCPSSYLQTNDLITKLLTQEFPDEVEQIERVDP